MTQPCEAISRECAAEISDNFSRKALFCSDASPAGWYLPIVFFFFNTATAIDIFLSNYSVLQKNKWYQNALENDRVIPTYADACSIIESNEDSADNRIDSLQSSIQKFFGSYYPQNDQLHFKYSLIDYDKARKILILPFQHFQTGDRHSYVICLHQPVTSIAEPFDERYGDLSKPED